MLIKLQKIFSHHGFKKYFFNTGWLMGEKILRMFVGLFVGVWVARYLGPERFGLLCYAQSFVGLFSVFATLGLDSIVVRELVKNKSRRDELIGTTFWLKLMGAIAMLVILAIVVLFTSNDHYTNILVFIIASATIFQSFSVIDLYFQSKVLSRYVVFANIISLFINSLVKIVLILHEAPLIAFAWMVLFDNIILACGFIYFFLKNNSAIKIINLTFNKPTAVSLLRDSWPVIFSGSLLTIQAYIDQIMIQEFRGSIEVSYYSVAIKLIAFLGFMPMLIKNSLFPAIQCAKKYSDVLYKERLLNFYRLNFLLFLFFAVPLFLFAENMVVLLYGQDYHPAGVLLALLGIRLFFTNMGAARSVFILIENLMKFSMITLALGTIVNIGLNLLWIPEYGAKGAIFATIISFTVTIFPVDMLYSKTRPNTFLQLKSIFTFYKIKFLGTI